MHRAIIAGERETGVTIMRVVKALDAGPMMAKVHRAIGPDETSDEVERDLAGSARGLLVETIDALAAGSAVETPQDDAAATYAHRLTKDDGDHRLESAGRATSTTWSAACTRGRTRSRFTRNDRFILRRSSVSTQTPSTRRGRPRHDRRGARRSTDRRHRTRVSCSVLEIQAEGKRPMSAREFLAGHRLSAGAGSALTLNLEPSRETVRTQNQNPEPRTVNPEPVLS